MTSLALLPFPSEPVKINEPGFVTLVLADSVVVGMKCRRIMGWLEGGVEALAPMGSGCWRCSHAKISISVMSWRRGSVGLDSVA